MKIAAATAAVRATARSGGIRLTAHKAPAVAAATASHADALPAHLTAARPACRDAHAPASPEKARGSSLTSCDSARS